MDETLASAALTSAGGLAGVRGRFPASASATCDRAGAHFSVRCATRQDSTATSVRGDNDHHKIEAAFKALARALRHAIRREGVELPSTKGAL